MLFILLTCYLQSAYAQVVINGGGKIRLDGGTASSPAYLVLNNSPAIPITASGANDGIITEAEYNRLQREVRNGD